MKYYYSRLQCKISFLDTNKHLWHLPRENLEPTRATASWWRIPCLADNKTHDIALWFLFIVIKKMTHADVMYDLSCCRWFSVDTVAHVILRNFFVHPPILPGQYFLIYEVFNADYHLKSVSNMSLQKHGNTSDWLRRSNYIYWPHRACKHTKVRIQHSNNNINIIIIISL